MKKLSFALAAILAVSLAMIASAEDPFANLSGEELWRQATMRFFPLPADVPNPENPMTEAKVELGKTLYYDTRLSKDGNVSCDSCHMLAEFGVEL